MSYQDGGLDTALKGKRKNPLIDDIIDKPSLAVFLDLSEDTITNYQKRYGLPFIPIGEKTYFSIQSVYKWFKENETTLVPKEIEKNGGSTKASKESNKVKI